MLLLRNAYSNKLEMEIKLKAYWGSKSRRVKLVPNGAAVYRRTVCQEESQGERASEYSSLWISRSMPYNAIAKQLCQISPFQANFAKLPSWYILWPYIKDFVCFVLFDFVWLGPGLWDPVMGRPLLRGSASSPRGWRVCNTPSSSPPKRGRRTGPSISRERVLGGILRPVQS